MESKRTSLIAKINEMAKKNRIKAINKYLNEYQGNKEDYLARARAFYDEIEGKGINTSAEKVESINMFVPYMLSPNEKREPAQKRGNLRLFIMMAVCFLLMAFYVLCRRLL